MASAVHGPQPNMAHRCSRTAGAAGIQTIERTPAAAALHDARQSLFFVHQVGDAQGRTAFAINPSHQSR